MKRLAILLPFLLLGAAPVFGQETQTTDFESIKSYGTGIEHLVVINSDNKQTQFYYNAQSPKDSVFNSIEPDWIESIDVFKGQNAVDRYGEEGANGVIVMTLKEGTLKKLPDDIRDLFKEI